jgi:hypothetical protein
VITAKNTQRNAESTEEILCAFCVPFAFFVVNPHKLTVACHEC